MNHENNGCHLYADEHPDLVALVKAHDQANCGIASVIQSGVDGMVRVLEQVRIGIYGCECRGEATLAPDDNYVD